MRLLLLQIICAIIPSTFAGAIYPSTFTHTAPNGYLPAAHGAQENGSGTRFCCAFNADYLISEIKPAQDVGECATLCDQNEECRAIFLWHDGYNLRCRLLRRGSGFIPTQTVSISYLKDEIKNFNLVATGVTGDGLRFSNAFDDADKLYAVVTPVKIVCLNACFADTSCMGVFVEFRDQTNDYSCNLLSKLNMDLVSTNIDGSSYARLFASLPPDDYQLVATGKIASSLDCPMRFKEAFDDAYKIGTELLDITQSKCAEECTAVGSFCKGVHYYYFLRRWRCRLLSFVEEYPLHSTNLPGYSLRRIPKHIYIAKWSFTDNLSLNSGVDSVTSDDNLTILKAEEDLTLFGTDGAQDGASWETINTSPTSALQGSSTSNIKAVLTAQLSGFTPGTEHYIQFAFRCAANQFSSISVKLGANPPKSIDASFGTNGVYDVFTELFTPANDSETLFIEFTITGNNPIFSIDNLSVYYIE